MTDNKENIKMTIDDKLFKVKCNPSESCHLIIDAEKCKNCKVKSCTFVCPANVYEWDEENKKIIIGYENCLECGACRIACEEKAIDWEYPKGDSGVTFKYG